ncbi:MerR family transcriptional regulator [Nocardioides sp.]|uniref:heat shock protein transcriptional repressor HspR n=1 Tax=Nocardioides sp. TaxID=35761 RepID=UPI00262F84CD|nr:MerR family transcriptional regulator [Nocardioides sp.]
MMATPTPDKAVYVISVAAELTGLHPQTLRTYERLGLITPRRTGGGGRRYSSSDIELLRSIASLTAEGIGIEGVRRILELENRVAALLDRNQSLAAEVEALRGVVRTTQAAHAAQAARPAPVAPVVPTRLPALRPPEAGQSLVVWRRRG